MNELEHRIAERIKKQGPLTFASFMEMALYEPALGYYASDMEIGRAGDFYTSQHVHPAFGSMIGKQLEEMWDLMNRPQPFYAIEPGAGAGLMCFDILHYLRNKPLRQALHYIIVERNPAVLQKQKDLLREHSGIVGWVESLREIEQALGCVLSNELLDSFPVHLIQMEEELREVHVAASEGDAEKIFRELLIPPGGRDIERYLDEFSVALPHGYRTEVNLRMKEWIGEVSAALKEGFVLTIDYGYSARDYYSPERNRGTLLCYHKHQLVEDPYVNVGAQDITAHVNFSSLKKWGEAHGFEALGFCSQGNYLISLGIDSLISELFSTSNDYLFEIARIKRLLFPGTLGDSHKVMIQYKGMGRPELEGFTMKNKVGDL
jgi:SAM-dependent MidA family methyltransferase